MEPRGRLRLRLRFALRRSLGSATVADATEGTFHLLQASRRWFFGGGAAARPRLRMIRNLVPLIYCAQGHPAGGSELRFPPVVSYGVAWPTNLHECFVRRRLGGLNAPALQRPRMGALYDRRSPLASRAPWFRRRTGTMGNPKRSRERRIVATFRLHSSGRLADRSLRLRRARSGQVRPCLQGARLTLRQLARGSSSGPSWCARNKKPATALGRGLTAGGGCGRIHENLLSSGVFRGRAARIRPGCSFFLCAAILRPGP